VVCIGAIIVETYSHTSPATAPLIIEFKIGVVSLVTGEYFDNSSIHTSYDRNNDEVVIVWNPK
jgi:hypothetical protein